MRGSTCSERQRGRGPAFEIAAEKAIRRHAELEGGLRGVFGRGRAVFLGQRQHAEDAADTGGALVRVDVIADGVQIRPGMPRAGPGAPASSPASASVDPASAMRCQPRGARTCSRSSWPVFGSSSRTRRSFHCTCDALADPAGRRPVVGGLDFDAAIEMHGAHAEAVIAKRLDRQRLQRGLLLGKHRGDLAFGRAVDARVRPVRFPAIEIGLRLRRALEAQPVERRLLRVADAAIRPCPCDRDRRRGTAARRRRSARARRGRAD